LYRALKYYLTNQPLFCSGFSRNQPLSTGGSSCAQCYSALSADYHYFIFKRKSLLRPNYLFISLSKTFSELSNSIIRLNKTFPGHHKLSIGTGKTFTGSCNLLIGFNKSFIVTGKPFIALNTHLFVSVNFLLSLVIHLLVSVKQLLRPINEVCCGINLLFPEIIHLFSFVPYFYKEIRISRSTENNSGDGVILHRLGKILPFTLISFFNLLLKLKSYV
jgi:hypothetical protein